MIVFGSEYRTAPGRVLPGRPRRGACSTAARSPSRSRRPGSSSRGDSRSRTVAPVGDDGDPCTLETAESLAAALGAAPVGRPRRRRPGRSMGSKPGTATGRVTLSAAAQYLIELIRCPVVVLPRGVALRFGSACRLGRDVPTESRRVPAAIRCARPLVLGLLACALLLCAVGAFVLIGDGSSSSADARCVSTRRPGFMGAATYTFCGKDAVAFCRRSTADDRGLASQCARLRVHPRKPWFRHHVSAPGGGSTDCGVG